MTDVAIGGRRIGAGEPCYVIAEAGVNHDGSLERALALIDVAADAGADAVKFQTFDADRLATPNAPKAGYQLETTDSGESQLDMLRRLQLDGTAYRALIERCARRAITFLSTPFDEPSADLLERLGIAAFKLPSGEITNLPFLAHVARFGKPLIASTGMANLREVEAAVLAIRAAGNDRLVLLHCVSNYPAAPCDANLRAMATLSQRFGVPAGYSDHTLGIEVALAAVALGATVLEKHVTLDRSLPGPDHRASLEPHELNALVRGVRIVEASLGDGRKEPAASEAATASVARKSLVAARDLAAGSVVALADVDAKRPGTGLAPSLRDAVVGRRVCVPVAAGALLAWEMFG